MITSPAWKDKKYAVLGLARSGRATVEALLAAGADVLVWDDRAEAREPYIGRCAVANPLDADLTGYAGVIVSPGVPLNTHPIKPHADSFGVPVIGDVELFAQARAELPPHKIVGITGTNGKSTTTALVHHILQEAGVPATMGGNIGLPILEQEPLPEGGVYVLELSSYQIDLTYSLDCDVAVLLNITPDHLDRYDGDFAKYAASKSRLLAMQRRGQNSIARFTDARVLGKFAEGTIASILEDVLKNRGVATSEQADWPSLQGPHNLENAAAAIEVCDILGLAGTEIRADEYNIAVRVASMENIHRAVQVTGAMSISAGLVVEGTLLNEMAVDLDTSDDLKIGNPSGVLRTRADARKNPDGSWNLVSTTAYRTFRRIMDGHVYHP